MKYLIFISIIFLGCQKENLKQDIILPVEDANRVVLKADKRIDSVWDGKGKVLILNDYKILSGTLKNWVIQAPYNNQIFDTSVTLVNVTSYDNTFSIRWYSASTENKDNWWNIQKSINYCVNNMELIIPKGNYSYSKPLASTGKYTATYLRMTGEGDLWNSSSTLTYTGLSGFGFGIQLAKGGLIQGITFAGQYKSPPNNGIPYYSLTQDQYVDISGKTDNHYSGIVVDYDNVGIGGSTGLTIRQCQVWGYKVAYDISPNAKTYNADLLTFDYIRGENCNTVFQSSQGQEKGNVITYIASWYGCHTLISIGNSGKFQAGNYIINAGNIAGSCIRLFNISLAGWNSFTVQSLTVESIGTMGNVFTGDSRYNPIASLNNIQVRFALKEQAGVQTLLNSNSFNVVVSNSTFWYYGSPLDTLHFKGNATFVHCNFSGPQSFE